MFKNIKLRLEILAVFLSLIVLTSVVIITFTYRQNAHSIRHISQGTIKQISSLIEEKVDCLIREFERIPEESVGLLLRHPEISQGNTELIACFLDRVKFHPDLYAFYTGNPRGDALIVFSLSATENPFTLTDFMKPLPGGAAYAYILVDRSGAKPKYTIYYIDQNLKEISSKEIPFHDYDPRVRPWYIDAEKTGKLSWTDVFRYDPTNDLGIAVSAPVYDQDGKLIAVIGADLSFKLLSEFLTGQKVGTSGKAYILDASGKVLIPDTVKETPQIVSRVYQEFSKTKERNFLFSWEGKDYLASVRPFPHSFGNQWFISIIDPFADFFAATVKTQKEVVLISLAILVLASLLIIFFSNHISAPIVTLSKEIDKITHLDLESGVRVKSNIQEMTLMDASIASLRTAIRSFSRYVPKEVVKDLIQKGLEIAVGGEKKEVTIFFTDIDGFTPITETLPVETVMKQLSEYFDILSKCVLDHQGTIDKYMGDGVMAFWGAPREISDHAIKACTAALQSQQAISEFNKKEVKEGMPEFHTRIGIHTGSVIVGNFGTSERMNYTVIGDPVNTSSRLERLNKIYRTKILISEEVFHRIGDQFLVRPLDLTEVKGKKNKIKIFELVNWKQNATSEEIELCERFTNAYEAFQRQDLDEAKKLFQSISQKFPNDYPTQYYLGRLTEKH